MKRLFRINNQAVSQVIGYILTFGIISTVTATVVYTTGVMIDRRSTVAAEIIAQSIANYLVDAITDGIAVKQDFPNADYSRTINVPLTINGKSYYIEATDDKVYVNTTDGRISAHSTTYGQEEICIGISGRAYPFNGKIKVYCNKTEYMYKIDFGTRFSPGERGYTRMSNRSSTANWKMKQWKYRAPIYIVNYQGDAVSYSQINVLLTGDNFDYTHANRNASDLRFVDTIGKILPYWIENWDYYGTSSIWVNVTSIPSHANKTIYLYYGNPKASPYSNATKTFNFFEDFNSDSLDTNIWSTYLPFNTSYIKVENGYVEIGYGAAITTVNYVLKNGILISKASAAAMSNGREASMLARYQIFQSGAPYAHAYCFSSGDFSSPDHNLAILEDNTTVLSNANGNPQLRNGWYRISFALNGNSLYGWRYEYDVNRIDGTIPLVTNRNYTSGSIGLYVNKDYAARYDWVAVSRYIYPRLEVYVCAPDCIDYTLEYKGFLKAVYRGDKPNYLHNDVIYSTDDAFFNVSLPNGVYSVTVTFGDYLNQLRGMDVYAENTLKIGNISCEQAYFKKKWFTIEVTDNKLNLRFHNRFGSYWSIPALTIEKGIRGVRIGEA